MSRLPKTFLVVLCAAALAPAMPAPATAAAPLCFGQPATIVGTAGPDRLVGRWDVADVIVGRGGEDFIAGSADFYDEIGPGDLLCGGPGADTLAGSPAGDRMSGGDGRDHLDGQRGPDLLLGNAGADELVDESFADMDTADDVLRGGYGDDALRAGWGNDRLYGNDGADDLIDAECTTTHLYGGGGADYLMSWTSSSEGWEGSYCGSEPDYVYGNDGYDRADVSANDVRGSIESLTVVTHAS